MLLSEFVGRYADQRPISPACLTNYRKHVHDFESFTGHPVRLRELSPQLVDSWLTSKLRAGRSPYYVVGLRSSVLAVWRAAWEEGLASRVPRAVRIRRPDLLVRCWAPAQVAELIVAARRVASGRPGFLRGTWRDIRRSAGGVAGQAAAGRLKLFPDSFRIGCCIVRMTSV